jgi:hypothetical protein
MMALQHPMIPAPSFRTLQPHKARPLKRAVKIIKQGSMENLWKGVPWEMSVTDGPQQDSRTFFVVRFSAAQK